MRALRLVPTDLGAASDLLRQAHAESKYRTRRYDEARATVVLQSFLGNPKLFARGLFEGDKLAGIMLGEVADSLWWSSELIATSMTLYVAPEHRGRGFVLIRAFLRWAKLSGASRANIGVTAGIRDTMAGHLMIRLGLQQAGIAYEKEF